MSEQVGVDAVVRTNIKNKLKKLKDKTVENNLCLICQAADPEVVCVDYLTFNCTQCGDVHSEFGHTVKSIEDGVWTEEEYNEIQSKGGNKRAGKKQLSAWDQSIFARPVEGDTVRIKDFIRKAFVIKCWFKQPKIKVPSPQTKGSDKASEPLQDASLELSPDQNPANACVDGDGNQLVIIDRSSAVYCVNHDLSSKRPKGAATSMPCGGCQQILVTNYCTFAFCPACSANRNQCMLCGAAASSSMTSGTDLLTVGETTTPSAAANDQNASPESTSGGNLFELDLICMATPRPAAQPAQPEKTQPALPSIDLETVSVGGTRTPSTAASDHGASSEGTSGGNLMELDLICMATPRPAAQPAQPETTQPAPTEDILAQLESVLTVEISTSTSASAEPLPARKKWKPSSSTAKVQEPLENKTIDREETLVDLLITKPEASHAAEEPVATALDHKCEADPLAADQLGSFDAKQLQQLQSLISESVPRPAAVAPQAQPSVAQLNLAAVAPQGQPYNQQTQAPHGIYEQNLPYYNKYGLPPAPMIEPIANPAETSTLLGPDFGDLITAMQQKSSGWETKVGTQVQLY